MKNIYIAVLFASVTLANFCPFSQQVVLNQTYTNPIIVCAPDPVTGDETATPFIASGGPTSSAYGNNENYTATFCPNTPGDMTVVTFAQFNLNPAPNTNGNSDWMYFYDGPNATSPLIASFTGNTLNSSSVFASPLNTSGCITMQFISNSSATGFFSGSVSCSTPCSTPLAAGEIINGENINGTISTNFIKVCIGEEVQFIETTSLAGTNYSLESFTWDFMDGNETTTTDDNAIVSHSWQVPGQYLVQLFVNDDNLDNECVNNNLISLEVLVAPYPEFLSFQEDVEICVGETFEFTAEPELYEVTWSGFDGATTVEDGCMYDDPTLLGVPQDVEIYQTGFSAGSVISDSTDIESICIEMEHSFMGDLILMLTCPNNQSIVLHQQGGSGAFLGEPIDDFGTDLTEANCGDPNVTGVPYTYCFSPGQNTTWVEAAIPGGSSLPAGSYQPVEPFSNLDGCPANGIWTLSVIDNWGADDGTIFTFELNLAPSFYPPVTEFTPQIDIGQAMSFWNTVNLPSYAIVGDMSGNADQIVITPTQSGTDAITYTVIDDFGCENSISFDVTAVDLAPISAGVDLEYACGDLTLLGGFNGLTPCSDCQLIDYQPYPNGLSFNETFCPDLPGYSMAVTVNGQIELNYDELNIFNGQNLSSPNVFSWGVFGDPTTYSNQQIVSTDASGCLTLTISSDNSIGYDLSIQVNAISPTGEIISSPASLYTYTWSPATNLNNPNLLQPTASNISNATTYTITAYPVGHENVLACAASDEMEITISALGDPGISTAPPTFCDNLTAPINIFNLLGGNPSNINDSWIMPDGSTYTGITTDISFDVTTASPADATYPTYIFTHEVSLGTCSTQATVSITVSEPLTATVTAGHEICDDAETDLEVLTTNEGLAPYFYQWSFNGTNIAGLEDLMGYAPDQTGDYCVTITDACNHNIQPCVHIDVRPKAPVTIDALTTAACWPDPFNLSITTDPALYQDSYWEISSGQTFMNMPNLNLQMENPGTYDVSLTLEDDLGCIYDTIIYNYFESYAPPTAGWLASDDEVSSFDPLVSFTNMTEGDIVSYSWTFDNANDQYFSEEFEPTFTYPFGVGGDYEVELQVVDVNGCISVATGNIEVQEPFLFFIPTGFTPNGDNINDALQIVSNDLDEAVFEMTIFNRWGQTVFHTNDPNMPWMGQQLDSQYFVPNGVYMWNATVRSKATGEKKEINGTITITR